MEWKSYNEWTMHVPEGVFRVKSGDKRAFEAELRRLGGASAAGLVGLLLAIDLGVDEGVGRIEGQGRIAAAFLGSALAGLLTFTLMHLRFRRGVVQCDVNHTPQP